MMTDNVLYAVGFEDALIGVGTQYTQPLAVYDWDRCVEILMTRDGMTEEDAVDYLDFNVTGAYVGQGTPVFMRRGDRDGHEGPATE